MRIHADPDPQPCFLSLLSSLFFPLNFFSSLYSLFLLIVLLFPPAPPSSTCHILNLCVSRTYRASRAAGPPGAPLSATGLQNLSGPHRPHPGPGERDIITGSILVIPSKPSSFGGRLRLTVNKMQNLNSVVFVMVSLKRNIFNKTVLAIILSNYYQ